MFSESTKEQRDYLEKKRRRLEEDVERYKKKLHDAEKSLKVRGGRALALAPDLECTSHQSSFRLPKTTLGR
jgi:hypothetical protein